MLRRFWLMKCEPEAYTIADLEREGSTAWEGVRNYQARNLLRDDMQAGDGVLFYASNAEPSGVTGCTERRLPFCVTIIFSSPGVALSVASGIVAANRSTKPISTEYQTGAAFVDAASKYSWPFFHAVGSGKPARTIPARPVTPEGSAFEA